MTREEPVTTLRTRPLRIEPSLTRDYVNQADKMREIRERLDYDRTVSRRWQVCGWVVGGLITACVLLWWGLQ